MWFEETDWNSFELHLRLGGGNEINPLFIGGSGFEVLSIGTMLELQFSVEELFDISNELSLHDEESFIMLIEEEYPLFNGGIELKLSLGFMEDNNLEL